VYHTFTFFFKDVCVFVKGVEKEERERVGEEKKYYNVGSTLKNFRSFSLFFVSHRNQYTKIRVYKLVSLSGILHLQNIFTPSEDFSTKIK
jgi:hypothetical protein